MRRVVDVEVLKEALRLLGNDPRPGARRALAGLLERYGAEIGRAA